jgi:hypothetical protein
MRRHHPKKGSGTAMRVANVRFVAIELGPTCTPYDVSLMLRSDQSGLSV